MCLLPRLSWVSLLYCLVSFPRVCRPHRAEDRPIIPSTIRSYADVAAGPPSALQGAEFAYVRRESSAGPLEPAFRGTYRVLDLRAKTVKLQVGEKEEWITVDRVKPHRGEAAVVPASPPRRGRLPG